MAASLSLITTRAGRQVPFDPDEISKDLFAVLESLGRADAFLARELADGVLHFLAGAVETEPLTTALVAETVIKVVRELGQPAVAQAFSERASRPQSRPETAAPPDPVVSWTEIERVVAEVSGREKLARRLGQLCLQEYSLRAVFGRDLAAAHAAGILMLGGLDWPFEVAGTVAPVDKPALALVLHARKRAGDLIILDGPEHGSLSADGARSFAKHWKAALQASGMWSVINLNVRTPPAWAGALAGGPLFSGQDAARTPQQLAATADALAEAFSGCGDAVRLDWHLAAADWQPAGQERLLPLVRRALAAEPIAFTFDRSRQPIGLAEGIDRQHPALLATVGLNLAQLAKQEGVNGNPVLFLRKLGSLARMALSAAARKRDFLRRHAGRRPELAAGFLLERARVVIEPHGLTDVVRGFLGKEPATDPEGLDLARRIKDTLRDGLRADAAARHLDACLEMAPRLGAGEVCADFRRLEAAADIFPGSTAVLRAAHEAEALEALRRAWEESSFQRVRFRQGG